MIYQGTAYALSFQAVGKTITNYFKLENYKKSCNIFD